MMLVTAGAGAGGASRSTSTATCVDWKAEKRKTAVSATPLREALSALTARGLVLNQPYVGFSVAPMPDAAFLRDLYATRLRIEPWIAGLAAKSRPTQLVVRLSASLADMAEVLGAREAVSRGS
jgi:DNA-binding GntR family transcriptional regulator